jgi:uncharacterized protein DUF3800
MLETYADESTAGGSTHYVVAGWLSEYDQWQRFNDEWAMILSKRGLSSFHMVDFQNRALDPDSDYRHINRAEGRILLTQLALAIRSRVRQGFVGLLSLREYESIFCERDKRWVGRPYTLATYAFIIAARRWAHRVGQAERVAFYFEEGADHRGQLNEAFERSVKTPELNEPWHGPQSFLRKGDARGLEAADMLAYLVYRHYHYEAIGKRNATGWLLDELAVIPTQVIIADEATLEAWIAIRGA